MVDLCARNSATIDEPNQNTQHLLYIDMRGAKNLEPLWKKASDNGIDIFSKVRVIEDIRLSRKEAEQLLGIALNLDAYLKAYVSNAHTLYDEIITALKTFLGSEFLYLWFLWD